MPVRLEHVPRDSSGIVVELFRLRHRDPQFSEALGPVVFDRGVSTEPVTGPVLERMVAALGEDLSLEPWEPTRASAAQSPPAPRVPPTAPPSPAQEPPPEVSAAAEEPTPAASFDELPNDKDALLAIAAARGIPLNAAWSAKAMRKAIHAHHR